jgi:hypothetical protein
MKLVEITIILSAPDDTSDRDMDAMVEAYEDLGIPGRLRDIIDLNLESRLALRDVTTYISES